MSHRRRDLAHRAARALAIAILLGAPVPCLAAPPEAPAAPPPKKVLIVYEAGPNDFKNGLGDARQLRQLLGHFHTAPTLIPATAYRPGQVDAFDITFFVGFTPSCAPPQLFLRDVIATRRPLVWLNTGMERLAHSFDLAKRFGFTWERFDTTSVFDSVDGGGNRFTKTEPNANVIEVVDPSRCRVLATTTSSKTKATIPYAVQSGNFTYFVDSPFSYATEADRYLYFADLLHDLLGENHPTSHSALIRIEDTNPFSDPASLRAIADLLSQRGVPFLVGVIPFYVNPADGTRVAMSDKPDYVDALHYMAEHGGTIVMHGTTHQYKGETAVDYEYWDESGDRILPVDSREYVERKMRDGISECLKNGVYPLLWETPHYSASELDYSVFGEHFSTAVEQRLVLDRLDFSQYFPYVIYHDMYGQRIYPENLGYVPLDPDPAKEQAYVDRLIGFAKANLAVRDGFASAFFHPFVRLDMLARLVDGIRDLGYTFLDLRRETNVVTLDDRAIVSGDAQVKLTMRDQYLRETYINTEGQEVRREISERRMSGDITRDVKLDAGWIYLAEPMEFRERTPTFWDRATLRAARLWRDLVPSRTPHAPAYVLALTDPKATGGALNDQTSLAAPFVALNMPVDTLAASADRPIEIGDHNLVVVPYNVADLLSDAQIDALKDWVVDGGRLITDFRNPLAEALGVKFLSSTIRIDRARDRRFPEEALRWRGGEVMNKFDTRDDDEVLVADDVSGIPVAIGRTLGKGKLILFGTRFDPASTEGYSRFPYIASHVQRFFGLTPLLRREHLEMYFDPGFRHTVSIEQLVVRWAAAGIRVIDVGGWHEYPRYTYDYGRLIRLAHASGILVYCWLEPPQVSQKFWQDHPEWREKNFKGQDIQPPAPSWRYPVALTDPACLKAALAYYRKLLTTFDWDGVNIAELCFDSGRGFKDPAILTPMHPSAREQFRKLAGFDPAELLEPGSPHFWRRDPAGAAAFVRYRVKKVTQLHEVMLELAEEIRARRPGFGVVLTSYDSLSAPELRSDLGVDGKEIAALAGRYDFTLQVEDPTSMWSTDPRRYETIASRWGQLVDPARLALDLNVLVIRNDKEITPFPTRIQTGTEAFWLVNSAARGARHVTIYCESSINAQDLALLPSAYAARARVRRLPDGWGVTTPTPVVLQLSSGTDEIWLDGERVHTVGDGAFLLTSGAHSIRAVPPGFGGLSPEALETRVLSVTGNLTEETSSLRSVRLAYRSENRCLITLTRPPFALFVDGKETGLEPLKGNGRYAVMLPPGEHAALVVTQSTVSYGVDVTSFWSSSLIALFGAASVGLLFGLYVLARFKRRLALR